MMNIEQLHVSEVPFPDSPDFPEHVSFCGFQSFWNPCSTGITVQSHPIKLANSADFGAALTTECKNKKDVNKLKTYKHFFSNVKEGSVAQQLQLDNDDEIITIEDEFVPNDKHKAVLGYFAKEQTDGHRRLHLIVRREIRDGSVCCYEISAQLSRVSVDRTHSVVRAQNTRLTLNRPTEDMPLKIQVEHMYRVKGTDQYMQVTPTAATANHLLGNDMDKRVIKISKLEITGRPFLKVALASYDRKWYIGVTDGENVGVTNTETWFTQIKRGTEVMFLYNGKVLAYDKRKDRLVLVNRFLRLRYFYVFEEIVLVSGGDQVDGQWSEEEINFVVTEFSVCAITNSDNQMVS
ncbi:uncharacterized protein LOC128228427 [Mya arenaria]|uniref:uncharacterized protein LOC128228427 n=1 Tax=Mya arenaria TaxID=6604 RepID=UPI0022DF7426|nr:uncharacterized protein LOC128228427 [Mya arenaria]